MVADPEQKSMTCTRQRIWFITGQTIKRQKKAVARYHGTHSKI